MDNPADIDIRYDWSRLNHIQIGRFAEYFVKMEFTLFGFDIYTSEVDDRGIDFVIRRRADRYYDVQVKSLRGNGYIFFPKSVFTPRPNLYGSVVLFDQGKSPELDPCHSLVCAKRTARRSRL